MSEALLPAPLQGEALLDRVKVLVDTIGENFFELGQHLFEIKVGEVFKSRDYATWEEYCDAVLPFQHRKADHYIELWELYCRKLGYDYDEIRHIGWSKLVKVKGLIENRKDAKKWIKRCEENGRRAIETMVKLEKQKKKEEAGVSPGRPNPVFVQHDSGAELAGVHEEVALPAVDPGNLHHEELSFEDEDTGEPIPLHQFQVYLYEEQWKNVMAAMNRAGQLANSDKACYLLDLISSEFNTTYAETDDGGVAQKLEYHIKNLERVYGVQIEVEVPRNSRLRKMSRLDTD